MIAAPVDWRTGLSGETAFVAGLRMARLEGWMRSQAAIR